MCVCVVVGGGERGEGRGGRGGIRGLHFNLL